MSVKMEQDIKRWTAKRKSALVLDFIQGKTTVAEASRAYDLSSSEDWKQRKTNIEIADQAPTRKQKCAGSWIDFQKVGTLQHI